MHRIAPLVALPLLLGAPAWACPTVANGKPAALSFDTAQVALVRQGTTTTFTVSINPQGDSDGFALVLPVPALLARDEIRVLDGEVFARLNAYTGVLQIDDAGCSPPRSDSSGGADGTDGSDGGGDGGDGESGPPTGVTVEAEYLVGDYEITILSATESGALFTWLNAHDYSVAPAVVPALEAYIAEGMYFMAARVSEGAARADGAALPPLQVRYESAAFSIPLRLAALSSPGEQDMILYTIMDQSPTGMRAGIANYPEFHVPDQCMWGRPEVDDFEAFYESRFRPAWRDAGPAAWTVEWSGGWGDCSPCSGVAPLREDFAALGYVGDPVDHFMTRIHMRYTPAGAIDDLILYGSGIYSVQSTSYANANYPNSWCIEACPGSLGAVWDAAHGYKEEEPEESPRADSGGAADGGGGAKGGCAAAGGAGGGLLGLLSAVGLGLRRRRS
jgi:hypothetical protein